MTPVTRRNASIPALAGVLTAALWASLPAAPAFASDLRHHREMTERALRDLGWQDEAAIARLAQLALAADIGRIPGYTRAVMQLGLPSEVADAAELSALAETAPFSPVGTRGFHFAGLYRFSDVETRWRATEEWASWVADEIGAMPESETREHAWLLLLGLAAHAVQDFYCHSNWVGLLDEFTPSHLEASEFPTWEELMQDDGDWLAQRPAFDAAAALERLHRSNFVRSACDTEGGLQTGKPRTEPALEAPVPWGHRHAGGAEGDVVRALAVRATRHWVARLDARMRGAVPAPSSAVASR